MGKECKTYLYFLLRKNNYYPKVFGIFLYNFWALCNGELGTLFVIFFFGGVGGCFWNLLVNFWGMGDLGLWAALKYRFIKEKGELLAQLQVFSLLKLPTFYLNTHTHIERESWVHVALTKLLAMVYHSIIFCWMRVLTKPL